MQYVLALTCGRLCDYLYLLSDHFHELRGMLGLLHKRLIFACSFSDACSANCTTSPVKVKCR